MWILFEEAYYHSVADEVGDSAEAKVRYEILLEAAESTDSGAIKFTPALDSNGELKPPIGIRSVQSHSLGQLDQTRYLAPIYEDDLQDIPDLFHGCDCRQIASLLMYGLMSATAYNEFAKGISGASGSADVKNRDQLHFSPFCLSDPRGYYVVKDNCNSMCHMDKLSTLRACDGVL